MVFDKTKCIKLLKYKILVEKKTETLLRYHNQEKYSELQIQLSYIKDFLVWKQSFREYYKLFRDFKLGLINGDLFVEEFFDVFRENEKFLTRFVFSPENIKNLNINPKSFKFSLFIYSVSMECRLFETDPNNKMEIEISENDLRSYITELFPRLESFNDSI